MRSCRMNDIAPSKTGTTLGLFLSRSNDSINLPIRIAILSNDVFLHPLTPIRIRVARFICSVTTCVRFKKKKNNNIIYRDGTIWVITGPTKSSLPTSTRWRSTASCSTTCTRNRCAPRRGSLSWPGNIQSNWVIISAFSNQVASTP